jgi:hypothetical protein
LRSFTAGASENAGAHQNRKLHYNWRRAKMVVKVQIPIVTNEAVPQVLIYNRARTIEQFFPLTANLRKTLGNELKSFWRARLIPDPAVPGEKMLSLEKQATWRNW